MIDIVDAETRSRMMAGIRGRNTKPEMTLRSALHRMGVRYRLHRKDLPGKPDLVFPKFRSIVFVNGCFWHRHKGCRFATTPATRPEFWSRKFEANTSRDRRNIAALRKDGWRVETVWECSIKSEGAEAVARTTVDWLQNGQGLCQPSES